MNSQRWADLWAHAYYMALVAGNAAQARRANRRAWIAACRASREA